MRPFIIAVLLIAALPEFGTAQDKTKPGPARLVSSQSPSPKPILFIDARKGVMEIEGEHWLPESAGEKAEDVATSISCKRSLGVCALASGNGLFGVQAWFLSITSWTPDRILLRGESLMGSPCWKPPSYTVDATRGTVHRMDLPGTQSDRVECRTAPYQQPRKRVFELVHLGARQ
jgi:hypothetical protein